MTQKGNWYANGVLRLGVYLRALYGTSRSTAAIALHVQQRILFFVFRTKPMACYASNLRDVVDEDEFYGWVG